MEMPSSQSSDQIRNSTAEFSLLIAKTSQNASTLLSQGSFSSLAHHTEGSAALYRQKTGYTLRLADFSTSKATSATRTMPCPLTSPRNNSAASRSGANASDFAGASLSSASATGNATTRPAIYIDVGKLKSLAGTQTYAVPKNIDLWRFLAVTIWCDKFQVNVATAPLSSP